MKKITTTTIDKNDNNVFVKSLLKVLQKVFVNFRNLNINYIIIMTITLTELLLADSQTVVKH